MWSERVSTCTIAKQHVDSMMTHRVNECLILIVQATIEALYLICQSVLYVCVLYFMAGFDKTPGKSHNIALQKCVFQCIWHARSTL